MKFKLIVLFIICFCTFMHAQDNLLFKLKIINSKTFAPVEFAAVSISSLNNGLLADANGFVKLQIKTLGVNDSLVIYALSYENKAISILSLHSMDTNVIAIDPIFFQLPVADVNGISAKQVVSRAIKYLQTNFQSGEFYDDGNYVQYHCENGKFVRLIVADVSIKNQLQPDGKMFAEKEMVYVKSISRTKNLEQNNETHGDHFFDLLSSNPVYHQKGSMLNPFGLNAFKFAFDTTYSDETNYKIVFRSTDNRAAKYESGAILIDKFTYSILRLEMEELPNQQLRSQSFYPSANPFTWRFLRGKFVVEFEKQKGKWFTKNIYKMYSHNLIDNKVHTTAYRLDEFFELQIQTHNLQTNGNEVYSEFSNLYSAKSSYDDKLVELSKKNGFNFIPSEIVLKDVNDWVK